MSEKKLSQYRGIFKGIWLILLLLGLGCLMVLLLFFKVETSSPTLLSVGRLHPILLHFPVVLLAILLVLEVLQLLKLLEIPFSVMITLFSLSLFGTLAAIVSGYFLYASGEYSGFLIDQHYKGAVFTGVFTFVAIALYLMHTKAKGYYPIYITSLVMVNLAAVYTGHQGGSITHGPNYMTEYFPMINASDESMDQKDSLVFVYEDIIDPILQTKCAGCHNQMRAKGKLSVTEYAELFKKGESGHQAVVINQPSGSELYKRIMMPDSLDEHMPPAGKAPLESKEIEIIKFWIANGASANMKISSINDSAAIELIHQLEPGLKKYHFNLAKSKLTALEMEEELKQVAVELEIEIKRDEAAEGNLFVLSNTFPPVPFDGKKLKELKPYLDLFSKVSLVSSEIDDSDLYWIAQMSNLKELYLQKTKLKGNSLIQLSKLDNLEVLNLSYTETDDKALIDLIKFPKLKEVFIYSTKTSKDVIIAIQKYKPELKIHAEEGPYL